MSALIRVDLDRVIGQVDRRIFGGFIEHLGRCIYGGIFDEGSPLADERGFRTDVLDALRAAPAYRCCAGQAATSSAATTGSTGSVRATSGRARSSWPGAARSPTASAPTSSSSTAARSAPSRTSASTWAPARSTRPRRGWSTATAPATPTGRTCRRANGHPEPYGVRYWGLGNEMYGEWQIGSMSAEEYVAEGRRVRRASCCGPTRLSSWSAAASWGSNDWDRIVIDGLADLVRYHSIHLYTGSSDYYANVLQPHQADRALRICEAFIEQTRATRSASRTRRASRTTSGTSGIARATRGGPRGRARGALRPVGCAGGRHAI